MGHVSRANCLDFNSLKSPSVTSVTWVSFSLTHFSSTIFFMASLALPPSLQQRKKGFPPILLLFRTRTRVISSSNKFCCITLGFGVQSRIKLHSGGIRTSSASFRMLSPPEGTAFCMEHAYNIVHYRKCRVYNE